VRSVPPAVTELLRYMDPDEGFHGFVAFHGDRHRLAAGGLRVQAGLDGDTVAELAIAMTMKERLLGLAVDGAKAGIDYDPGHPGKREALGRFLRFLRPLLLGRLSLGPDLGTDWAEIEAAARSQGIPSVKGAVARAQELDEDDFWRRQRLLDAPTGGSTLGRRRAGHALAHAALAANEAAGGPQVAPRVAVQGFGTLGRGAVLSLARAGAVIQAVSDEHGCVVSNAGLPTEKLLATPPGTAVAHSLPEGPLPERRDALFETDGDVLVLAARENAMTFAQASTLRARTVVVGANLGLCEQVEDALHRRGILVIPDFVGGCGGSASMDALFGPPSCPTVSEVLNQVATRMRDVVSRVFQLSREQSSTPRQAAMLLCELGSAAEPGKPYGRWAAMPADKTGVEYAGS
jgi:glutamate dehydrogenase (NAD(P)+)